MNEVTIIFFGASVAVCIFALVTFFVVVSYHKALKRQRALEEELSKLKLEGSTEVNRILLEAQSKASEIVKNAQIKSQEFLNSSEVFSNDFKQKFQAAMLSNSNQIISNISKDIGLQIQNEMKGFQSALNKNIEAMVSATQAELSEYKARSIATLDAKVSKVVKDAAKKTIGKSLTTEEHQEIIIKALEEAKAQNVL